MQCLSKIDHYVIPNDIVVILGKIYRFVGNNDFYIKSLGSDLSRVIDTTVAKDAFYLAKILNLNISEARTKLIISKDSSPRNKDETTLYNIKELLAAIQQRYQTLGLQSNDLFNSINYMYSHYPAIKFDMIDTGRSILQSQSMRSKRLLLDDMNEIVKKYINNQQYEKIILYLHYFLDLYNLKPFTNKNETLSLVILYQLCLCSDLNAFKYVSFFELLYSDYQSFCDEVCKASINWKEGYAQTTEFMRFFLKMILRAYSKTDQIIRDYKFDRTNKKHENIETTILNMKSIFTKDEIRIIHPYVSESTINRALQNLRDEGYIEPLGKGRSAKWIRKK